MKEAEAANSLIDQGADVLTAHVDSPKVVIETAEHRGIFSTGYHASQAALAPKGYLTGAEWNWETVYKAYIEKIQKGEPWEHLVRGGFKENFVKMSPYGAAVSDATKAKADEVKKKFLDGTMVVYAGPAQGQRGQGRDRRWRRADPARHRAREHELPRRWREGPRYTEMTERSPVPTSPAGATSPLPKALTDGWARAGREPRVAARADRHFGRRRVRGDADFWRVFGLRRPQSHRRVRRDVPRRVRHLVLVPKHAAAFCAADADGSVHRVAAQLGLVVIGGEGALVVGGVAAAVAGLAMHGSSPYAVLTVMFLAGASAGGLWIALVGALRAYRGVNETISSLLMAYIAIALMNHLVEGPLRDPSSLNKPATRHIGDANMLGPMPGLDVHWGLLYGVVACVIGWVLMKRTVFGFAAAMTGGNMRAALLSGLRVKRLMVLTCFLAGAAAGARGHGRGRRGSRARQCLARRWLRLCGHSRRVRGAPKSPRHHPRGAVARRHRRQWWSLATKFQSAGRERQCAPRYPLHGDLGRRDAVWQVQQLELQS